MSSRVSASDPVKQLSLYVNQESRSSDTKHGIVEPIISQLFLDQNQPIHRILGSSEKFLMTELPSEEKVEMSIS